MLYAGATIPNTANAYVLAIAMIETASALAQIDEILDVPGLDAIYVGPADLSLALGVAASASTRMIPSWWRRWRRFSPRRSGTARSPGLHTATPAYAHAMLEKGFQLVTVATDAGFLEAEARRVAAATRGGNGAGQRADPY
jgi:4-hydroxy-2-oxoheptanedioate aldolase